MNTQSTIIALSVSAAVVLAPLSVSATPANDSAQATLSQLIHTALLNDSSREQFYAQSYSKREAGIASATLMDPKIKVGVTGLPVDSFEFDEDPMTNISVGLMQQFERGSTLDLKQRMANQQADGLALQVHARELEVANAITSLWLELGYQQASEQILREKRRLLKEMEGFVRTNYSIGKSEAQDLLNAQLQVSKLDEKLLANQQMQKRITGQMSEWLGDEWLSTATSLNANGPLNWTKLEDALSATNAQTNYYTKLSQHPMVKMADVNISVNRTQVDIAEQAYAPQFGVEVMYAYRQANNMRGEPASDLVSAYLTLDVPLFTGNRQDRSLSSAQYQVGASQAQKDTLLKQLNAKLNALTLERDKLKQRLSRYQSTLIPQASDRIKAVERGYQNNTAQFNDVILATTDELALKLEHQRLLTDLNIINSNLAALLNGFEYQVAAPELTNIEKE
ncbi:copper transporter [Vibrio nereis]|uniref:Copper transporter n=1 Tax=Vibrio nereis TaxID=693 RepID=A0A0M0HR88_VIBNE|nr:copper transporter [Vibrio nereis]